MLLPLLLTLLMVTFLLVMNVYEALRNNAREVAQSHDVDEIRQFQRNCLNRGGTWVTGIVPVSGALGGGWRVTCWELEP